MNRQEKSEEVGALRDLLDGAQLAVVAEYAGLSVADMVTLRTELRKSEARYRVVKNSLAKRAIEDTELAPLDERLTGPVGIVYTKNDDVAATAKTIATFAKGHKAFKIRGGVMADGTVLDQQGVDTLSNLPSKDQLRAMLLATFMGVPTKVVRLFSAAQSGFVRVLEAQRKKLAGED